MHFIPSGIIISCGQRHSNSSNRLLIRTQVCQKSCYGQRTQLKCGFSYAVSAVQLVCHHQCNKSLAVNCELKFSVSLGIYVDSVDFQRALCSMLHYWRPLLTVHLCRVIPLRHLTHFFKNL